MSDAIILKTEDFDFISQHLKTSKEIRYYISELLQRKLIILEKDFCKSFLDYDAENCTILLDHGWFKILENCLYFKDFLIQNFDWAKYYLKRINSFFNKHYLLINIEDKRDLAMISDYYRDYDYYLSDLDVLAIINNSRMIPNYIFIECVQKTIITEFNIKFYLNKIDLHYCYTSSEVKKLNLLKILNDNFEYILKIKDIHLIFQLLSCIKVNYTKDKHYNIYTQILDKYYELLKREEMSSFADVFYNIICVKVKNCQLNLTDSFKYLITPIPDYTSYYYRLFKEHVERYR